MPQLPDMQCTEIDLLKRGAQEPRLGMLIRLSAVLKVPHAGSTVLIGCRLGHADRRGEALPRRAVSISSHADVDIHVEVQSLK